MKADRIPVVIYGTGKFGIAAAEQIVSNEIPVFCFLDDEKYWFSDKVLTIQGKEIRCLTREQLMKKAIQYNMLLGMIDYSLLEKLKKEFRDCHYVEYLDVYSPHILKKPFLIENKKCIYEIYAELGDQESREVLEAYLHARYTGDVRRLSSLMHGSEYLYDWELLALSRDDVVVDGGAFHGDTIIEMRNYIGMLPKKIFAFEPDYKNYEKLFLKFMDKDCIQTVEAGLYSYDAILHFDASGTLGSSISENAKETVAVQAIDMHDEYHDASVIKLDIEGSELEALRGCERLIQKNKPRLAVCIYHHNEDIICIYNFLKQFSYRFFLRQHSKSVEETVLYAI